MKVLCLLAALCYLAHAQVSKKCLKANKMYPNNVNTRPAATTAVAKCDMYTESCCSMVTEYYMGKETESFTTLAMAGLTGKLRKVQEAMDTNSLTPTVFHEEFNDLVKKEGAVSYQELTRSALRYYIKDDCANHPDTVELINRIATYVKMIADPLKAIYSGLGAIKSALDIASEYKTSEECKTAIMQNGIYSDQGFKINKCQVCDRDTATLKPCENTCNNVVRGCLSDLTGVSGLLEELAGVLDASHYTLLREVERASGSLDYIEQDIRAAFERRSEFAATCATGLAYTFVNSNSQAQPANFTGKPLELQDAFTRSLDYVCIFSKNTNTNCWTAAGLTAIDESTIAPFTTWDQQYTNTVLARGAVQDDEVIRAEGILRETMTTVSKANSGYDMFVMEEEVELPEVVVEEEVELPEIDPTEAEEEIGETDVVDATVAPEEEEEEETVVVVEPEVEEEEEKEVDAGEEEADMGEDKADMGEDKDDMGEDKADMGEDKADMTEDKDDMTEGEDNETVDNEADYNIENEAETETEGDGEVLDTTVEEGASTDNSAVRLLTSSLLFLTTFLLV